MNNPISLTEAERVELNRRATSRNGRADDARRARLILLLEGGRTWETIRDKLDCNDAFIDRWNKRFLKERLAGLFSRHAGQEASTLTPRPSSPSAGNSLTPGSPPPPTDSGALSMKT